MNALNLVVARLGEVVQAASVLDSSFGRFASTFMVGDTPSIQHNGDLPPIPRFSHAMVGDMIPGAKDFAEGLATLANFSLAGCNFLYRGMRAVRVLVRPSQVQRHAQNNILGKWWASLRHASETDDVLKAFDAPPFFTQDAGVMCNPTLRASQVDGLKECGLVDPTSCLDPLVVQKFESPDEMFPRGLASVPSVVKYACRARDEYAKLVGVQLASRKVALMRRPTCSAGTFAVAKLGNRTTS